jgi:hypothetical protein
MRAYACAVYLALSLAPMATCGANDTAINAGSVGPSPMGEFNGDESVIRMMSESVHVRFGKATSHVKCRFVFRNTMADGVAKQTVGFPDFIIDEGDVGTITSLVTRVNGREVTSKKKRGWFSNEDFGMPRSGFGGHPNAEAEPHSIADFYCVEVEFPAGEDVVIEREYESTNGGSVEGNTTFSYSTHTGAVWRDVIGKGEFTVTLDGWTIDDLAFEDGPQKIAPRRQYNFCSPNKSEWTVVSPTELKMTWENFEPAVHRTRRGFFLTTWNRAPMPK